MTQEEFYTHLDQLYASTNYEEVERFLTFHIDLYKDGETANRQLLIAALTERGTLYRETGNFKASADDLEQALTWIAIAQGKDSMAYATTLHNLSMTYQKMEYHEEAILCLNAAKKMFEDHNTLKHPLYASILQSLSRSLMATGKKAEGVEMLEKALEAME